VNEIQRLLESLPDETIADATPKVATLRTRGGPAANTILPRGAFP
jgi:hypothetical protein